MTGSLCYANVFAATLQPWWSRSPDAATLANTQRCLAVNVCVETQSLTHSRVALLAVEGQKKKVSVDTLVC